MGTRIVNGNTNSENGWPLVDEQSCTWIAIPGTNNTVHLEIQNGQPLAIMGAFAADYHAYVMPLEEDDCACWTPSNTVLGQPGQNNGSNHLGGTAMDLRWNIHRFQISYDGYSPDQIAVVRELLDFYELTIYWGEDWGLNNIGPFDSMHFQMGYNTFGNAHTQDFINRKIRPDGFSTFRRGAMPATPPAVDVLVSATGVTPEWAAAIQPTVTSGLQASQCLNVNRIAMWLAQCGEESAGFSTTEEFASGQEYEGRCSDLGNCSPGDGVKYKGRTWIQITGKFHYGEFSQWAAGHGFVSSPTQFVDNPSSLADLQWAGIGAAWYWTVERPDINALSDAGDVVTVTQRINGGEHGLADRQGRYARAHALGDQLLALLAQPQPPPPPPGDDMAQVPQEQWDAFYHAYMDNLPSLSPLREPGEGAVGPLHRFVRNIDVNEHIQIVQVLATLGEPNTLGLLHRVAAMDLSQYPDRTQGDKDLAQQILADLDEPTPAVIPPAPPPVVAPPPPPAAAVLPPAPAPVSAPLPVVQPFVPAELPPVEATPVTPVATTPTTGGSVPAGVSGVLASLELYARFEKDLPAEIADPLARLIDVLRNY